MFGRQSDRRKVKVDLQLKMHEDMMSVKCRLRSRLFVWFAKVCVFYRTKANLKSFKVKRVSFSNINFFQNSFKILSGCNDIEILSTNKLNLKLINYKKRYLK